MATTSRSTRRTIRVHATERSTDQELFVPYAETTAMLLALVAVLAAAWVVAAPAETADLPLAEPEPAAAPEVYAVNRIAGSTSDVVWPDAFNAPAATAVTVLDPADVQGDEPIDATAPAVG